MTTIRCDPNISDPNYDVSLSDGITTVGLLLHNGQGRDKKAISRSPIVRTGLKTATGATQYSDLTPPYKSDAQIDWVGGRGAVEFEKDVTRYFDAYNVNTQHSGQLILGGQGVYNVGVREQDEINNLPGYGGNWGMLEWYALTGSNYTDTIFTATTLASPTQIEVWIRRVGVPVDDLLVEIYSGVTTYITASVTPTTITDTIGLLHSFDAVVTTPLTNATGYHLKIYTAGNGTAANHWEVGCDAMLSFPGPYYRIIGTDAPTTAFFFEYKGGLYIATSPDSRVDGKVLMNGYRGVADSNAADKTYLNDSTQDFSTVPDNSIVALWDGAGVTESQNWRSITSGQPVRVAVSPDWALTHVASGNTATLFNILGCNTWTSTGVTVKPTTDIENTGEIEWIASGEAADGSLPITRFRQYADATGIWKTESAIEAGVQATFIKAVPHATLDRVLWLASNNDAAKEVSIMRCNIPKTVTEALSAMQVYRSATTDGFMRERFLTPIASDSFDRADGAPGNTDGYGHTVAYPFLSGGSGKAWGITPTIGTPTISGNRLICTLSSGKGITGVDTLVASHTVQASCYRSAGYVGLVVRYADANNYVYCKSGGGQLALYKVVGGATTLIADVTTIWVTGDVMKLEASLTKFRMFNNGVQIGFEYTITDAALQGGTVAGVYTTDAANTWDYFVAWETAVTVTDVSTNSASVWVPGAFTTGIIASDVVTSADWRRYKYMRMVITSTKDMAAGELELLVDNNALCASPCKTVALAAMVANVTYGYGPSYAATMDVDMALTAVADAETVISCGLNLTIDPAINFTLSVAFEYLDPDTKTIPIGTREGRITGLETYPIATGGALYPWVLKEDGFWYVDTGDVAKQANLREMESVKGSNNGRLHLVNDVYLYFSLGAGIQRYYNYTLESVGPNLDAGMPEDCQGYPVHGVGYPGCVYVAYDGGDNNYSSVLVLNGKNWHTVYRAPRKGLRIRRIAVQVIPGDAPDRLWISQGADVLWIPIPSFTTNPYYDSNYRYAHEGYLTTAWMYLGMKDVSKVFHSVKIFSEGLTSGQTVKVEYRLDEATAWVAMTTTFTVSPMQEVKFIDNVRGKRIQFRIRLETDDNSKTPRITAFLLESITDVKPHYQYTMTFLLSDGITEIDEIDTDSGKPRAEDKLAILDGWVENLTTLTMSGLYSVFAVNAPKKVKIEAFPVTPTFLNSEDQVEQHLVQLTVVEV
jgi:hypothetical protein